MGTYPNTTPSVPHFGWFFPGSFSSAQKPSPLCFEGTQNDTLPGLPVIPIRSVPPTDEPVKNNSRNKAAKAKKPNPSSNGCNKIPPKIKQLKKKEGQSLAEEKREKTNLDVDVKKMNPDLSVMPSPICSCTGIRRVCYKWGAGGWQSSCCTKSISEHPLPMHSTRPGTRVAGRKMSSGAYLKLLLKLAAEGYELSHPVDLKHHWAKHGTNKFVTIK